MMRILLLASSFTNQRPDEPGPRAKKLIHPTLREAKDPRLQELRNLVSSVFIAMLIGLAYSELFDPVRAEVRSNGISFSLICLVGVFFLTSMRFFIGNQLHLLSDEFIRLRGDVWLYDFLVITIETSLLAFLGAVATVSVSRNLRIGFMELLVALYLIDVLWIVSQWLAGLLFAAWKRPFIPWAWAILNAALVVGILGIRSLSSDMYSTSVLALVFGLNIAAFMVDLFLIDHYDLL